jgi:hypothetical protein
LLTTRPKKAVLRTTALKSKWLEHRRSNQIVTVSTS